MTPLFARVGESGLIKQWQLTKLKVWRRSTDVGHKMFKHVGPDKLWSHWPIVWIVWEFSNKQTLILLNRDGFWNILKGNDSSWFELWNQFYFPQVFNDHGSVLSRKQNEFSQNITIIDHWQNLSIANPYREKIRLRMMNLTVPNGSKAGALILMMEMIMQTFIKYIFPYFGIKRGKLYNT